MTRVYKSRIQNTPNPYTNFSYSGSYYGNIQGQALFAPSSSNAVNEDTIIPLEFKPIYIQPTDWTLVGEMYECTYSNSNINVSSSIIVTPYNNCLNTVLEMKVMPQTEEYSGYTKMFALSQSAMSITVSVMIIG